MTSLQQTGSDEPKLGFLRNLRLGLSSSYYRMAEVFGLKRLQDFMLVCEG